MNNQEGLAFIREYFDELFGKRNVNALCSYLDKNYFDDDIGESEADHVKCSQEYLSALFKRQPTIGVDVQDAIVQDNVISAFLQWFVVEEGLKRIIRKGVAIFVVENRKIVKRHTYIYHDEA
jgi:hypothetical protein